MSNLRHHKKKGGIFRFIKNSALSRKILQLSLPVFLGMISQTLIHVTDAYMIGKLGPEIMAATGLGGSAFFTYIVLLMNGSIGVQIVTSRRLGEKNEIEIGKIGITSIWFAIFGGILFTIFSLFTSGPFIDFLSADVSIRENSLLYLTYRNYGLIFFFLSFVIRGFFDGLGFTKLGMINSFVTFLANVFLNWVLIYGNLGAPALGLKGAAIASSLAGAIGLIPMLVFLFKKNILYYLRLPEAKFEWNILHYVLKIGSPAALDGVLTHGSFLLFNKLSGIVGTYSLAANNIIFAVMTISFMPGLSFGIAATTLVGQALGEKKPLLARISTYRSALYAGILMGFMGFIFIVFANDIILSFNPDPLLLKETYPSLIAVALVQVGDAYHMVVGSALRSAGLVVWVLIAYIMVSYFIMLPLAYFLGIHLGLGTLGLWSSISFWIIIMGLVFLWKFRKGDWQKGKV